jgi:hypothetical protein
LAPANLAVLRKSKKAPFATCLPLGKNPRYAMQDEGDDCIATLWKRAGVEPVPRERSRGLMAEWADAIAAGRSVPPITH